MISADLPGCGDKTSGIGNAGWSNGFWSVPIPSSRDPEHDQLAAVVDQENIGLISAELPGRGHRAAGGCNARGPNGERSLPWTFSGNEGDRELSAFIDGEDVGLISDELLRCSKAAASDEISHLSVPRVESRSHWDLQVMVESI